MKTVILNQVMQASYLCSNFRLIKKSAPFLTLREKSQQHSRCELDKLTFPEKYLGSCYCESLCY